MNNILYETLPSDFLKRIIFFWIDFDGFLGVDCFWQNEDSYSVDTRGHRIQTFIGHRIFCIVSRFVSSVKVDSSLLCNTKIIVVYSPFLMQDLFVVGNPHHFLFVSSFVCSVKVDFIQITFLLVIPFLKLFSKPNIFQKHFKVINSTNSCLASKSSSVVMLSAKKQNNILHTNPEREVNGRNWKGSTEIWTRVAGYKVCSVIYYTIVPCIKFPSSPRISKTQIYNNNVYDLQPRYILYQHKIVFTLQASPTFWDWKIRTLILLQNLK